MTLCRYRIPASADPTRPRCGLDEGHRGEHAPDTSHERKRGRPPGDGTRPIPVRAPTPDLDAYQQLPDEGRATVRAATSKSFSREVRRQREGR